jgi:hypothetical protein
MNSTLAPSARSTHPSSAAAADLLPRILQISRATARSVSPPLRGSAQTLVLLSRSALRDIQSYVSHRYGTKTISINKLKNSEGNNPVFHLRSGEEEDKEVDVSDGMAADIGAFINDDDEPAPAAMDTHRPISVYDEDFEGDVILGDDMENEASDIVLSPQAKADLAVHVCANDEFDEEETQFVQLDASPPQQEVMQYEEDAVNEDIWDDDSNFEDDASVRKAICVAPPPQSLPSPLFCKSLLPPQSPKADGENAEPLNTTFGCTSRSSSYRECQEELFSSDINSDRASSAAAACSPPQQPVLPPHGDLILVEVHEDVELDDPSWTDEIWMILRHEDEDEDEDCVVDEGICTGGDFDGLVDEVTTIEVPCNDKTNLAPIALPENALVGDTDALSSSKTTNKCTSVSPLSSPDNDTSPEAARKVRLTRSHTGVSLAALIAAADLGENSDESSDTTSDSSASEVSEEDDAVVYAYAIIPTLASERAFSNLHPCLDPTFPGHSPCATYKSLGFGRSRGAALRVVRRRFESQDYSTCESNWYRAWMKKKHEAGGGLVMVNGSSSLRFEVSSEENPFEEKVVGKHVVQMSLKDELDAVSLNQSRA